VRLKFPGSSARLLGALLLCSAATAVASYAASAPPQNPDTMLPEQNVAKAREILNQLLDALGGSSYLEARERECDGRRAQFGHNGELTGFIDFKDYWRYPDKHRTDYSKKRNVIDMFNGNEGWTMDRAGVSEEPAAAVSDFQALVKHSVENLLRFRLKDKNLSLNYAGRDIIDMRPVDWVEVGDDQRTLRLAVDRTSHLLLRSVVTSVDENTQQRTQETTIYTNYQRKDGVMVALQVSRERDGRRFYQAFYENCTFNPHFPEDTFSKAALEKRYAEVGNKKDRDKYKNAKD
jgi:outer membrane lipoprotein-sorting protein